MGTAEGDDPAAGSGSTVPLDFTPRPEPCDRTGVDQDTIP